MSKLHTQAFSTHFLKTMLNQKITLPTRSLMFTLFCWLFGVLLAACAASPAATATPTASPLPTRTATHTRTATPSPTATLTPTVTKTPRPTATPDLSPKVMTTIGKGLVSDIVRSPDGKLVAILEGAETEKPRVRWLDAASGEEIGSAELGYAFGIVSFSSNNRWLLVHSTLGVYVIDTTTSEVEKCCSGELGFGTGYKFSRNNRYLAFLGLDYTSGGPYHFVDVYDLETHSQSVS
jgi:hypothetical protein